MLYLSIFNVLALLRYALGKAAVRRRAVYHILLFVLFLFTAFRYEVGCDWSGYYNQWYTQLWSSFDGALRQSEPLWWMMIDGLQQYGFSYPWLNVASSAIFFAGVHVLARRQPDRLAFLILLYPILIINMPMSGIRQGAAIGIMCMAFVAFNDRKLVPYLLLTGLATTIHSSAMVFLLLAPMVLGGFTANNLISSAVLAIPGAFLLAGNDDVELATSRYVNTGVDAAGAAFRVGLLFMTGMAFFIYFSKRWRLIFPQDFKLVGIGSLLMTCAILLVPVSSVIGDRLGYYLVPIQAIILARIPFLQMGRQSALFSAIPYAVLGLVLTVWVLNSQIFQVCYVPYQSWLYGFPEASKFRYMRY